MATLANKSPYREVQAAAGVTGSTVTITFDTVPTGKFRRYHRTGIINNTSATTKARLIMRGHGYDHLLWEENTLTAAVLYWDSDPVVLTEGEYLVMTLTGTTTGDYIYAFAIGEEGALGDL